MVLGLHYLTKGRRNVTGQGMIFSDIGEVLLALEQDRVNLQATIKLRLPDNEIIETTVGRAVLFDALPEGSIFSWVNKTMRKSDIAKLVENVYFRFGSERTVVMLDKIKKLGFGNATHAGISFGINDLLVPTKKNAIVAQAESEVDAVEQLYRDGVITNGERTNKVVSIWYHATAEVAKAMVQDLEAQDAQAFENTKKANSPYNPIYMMIESGARGSRDQVKQLVGIRGLFAKPNGETMETPVRSNFKEGLNVFEYFISTHGARKGQADTALKTAHSGYLTRRLVDVAQDVIISLEDCGTLGYIELEDFKAGGTVLQPLAARVSGRVIAADIKDPITGKLLFNQGHLISREDADLLRESAVSKIFVRSVLTCQARRGVCAFCYGLDLARGALVDIGTAVGYIAAQSIGEPGTQLTMRTFHIGGTATGVAESFYTAKHEGTVELRRVATIKTRNGKQVVVSRKGAIAIVSKDGRDLQEHALEYGAILHVEDKQPVTVGTKLADWDAVNRVLITENSGHVQYVDLIDNVTVHDKIDEATGATSKVVLEHKGDKHQPAISIVDDEGKELAHYYLPAGAYIMVANKQSIKAGDLLIKMPREASKSKDITGGLPQIADLFEARMPKDPAIISDIDGEIVFGGMYRGMRKVSVVSGFETFDYLIPRGKQLNVGNGDRISAGDFLTSGQPVLHDMLRIQGPEYMQRYLVNQIQEIYRMQGIDISDRHIELISRQMLRKVRVVDPGDSDFLVGDRVDKIHFANVNNLLQAEGKRPATAKPMLMGITMASLGTESFFSAASFQETTRVLAAAAVGGQLDYLYGLKENIIIGKLIPAGTGVPGIP